MAETLLVIGGCRSGKSRYALERAEAVPGDRKIYIATCVPADEEMNRRVERHRRERDCRWSTLEIPTRLPEAIFEHGPAADVLLVDCLTLWVSNLLMAETVTDDPARNAERLAAALKNAKCPVILVSNEVGAGIVPENRLARAFRDAAGLVNQTVAAAVEQVVWMVAGIPVPVKGNGR